MSKKIVLRIVLAVCIVLFIVVFTVWGPMRSAGEPSPLEPLETERLVELPNFDATPSPTPLPSPTPSETPTIPSEEPSEEPEPEKEPILAWPVHMYIPALGVDADIADTGTDYVVDSMEIYPSGTIISWWREGAIPGNDGNAIFGGHNRWGGQLGQLFYLDTLEIGELMVIDYEDGTSMEFRLESVFVYLLATAPGRTIMDVSGDARVTIITCKEPFNPQTGTSDNRIVAVFKPADGFEIPDPPIEPHPSID